MINSASGKVNGFRHAGLNRLWLRCVVGVTVAIAPLTIPSVSLAQNNQSDHGGPTIVDSIQIDRSDTVDSFGDFTEFPNQFGDEFDEDFLNDLRQAQRACADSQSNEGARRFALNPRSSGAVQLSPACAEFSRLFEEFKALQDGMPTESQADAERQRMW